MRKGKKGSIDNPVTSTELESLLQTGRDYKIIDAKIKDGFCQYSYEVTQGKNIGDKHSVKGQGIVTEDLNLAFAAMNVHLAVVDDIFKHSKIEFENLHTMVASEQALLYNVGGFKILGSEDNEAIVLYGEKYISSGGRISIETPRIYMDDASSYKWYYELQHASKVIRDEVSLYKEGKFINVQDEDEEGPLEQINMFDKKSKSKKKNEETEDANHDADNDQEEESSNDDMTDFEKAEI